MQCQLPISVLPLLTYLAGHPDATEFGGIFPWTQESVPNHVPAPIVDPGSTIEFIPIALLSCKTTGPAIKNCLDAGAVELSDRECGDLCLSLR
ncbi:unnamed protein product [marine sediment metagenome]|uniref:Uncharacterized protein n=1 Tax=marine sediment metagenome TaxID=412755 RepID=X1BGS0_9ZZZZ